MGIRLSFDTKGTAKIIPMKPVRAHRLDLIEQKLSERKFGEVQLMFYNSKVPDCEVGLTRAHVIREAGLYRTFLELSSPEAA